MLHQTSNNNNKYKILFKLGYIYINDFNYNSFENSLTNMQTFVSILQVIYLMTLVTYQSFTAGHGTISFITLHLDSKRYFTT